MLGPILPWPNKSIYSAHILYMIHQLSSFSILNCRNKRNRADMTKHQTLAAQHQKAQINTIANPSSSWSYTIRNLISLKKPKDAILTYTHTRRTGNTTILSVIPLVIKACASLSMLSLGSSFHSDIIKSGAEHDVMVGTSLLGMYAKCRDTTSARKLFDNMPHRNAVSWNAMIGGYMRNGETQLASSLFGSAPEKTSVTWNEMIDGYSRNGDIPMARETFDRMPENLKNVVTWTIMVNGYATNGNMEAADELFKGMGKTNFYVFSVMITGYFKKGDFKKARGIFDRMGSRNLVNWNSLISGYAQNGMCEEVFEAFKRMRAEGFDPDEVTVTSVLSACAQLGMLDIGKEIHDIIRNNRIKQNEFVLNGLIDMYAKCGDLENAYLVFESMPVKNTASWNSLIMGFAIHGRFRESIVIFEKMEGSGVNLDSVTFLSFLSACAHGGLVDMGLESFSKMVDKYRIEPNIKHYGCLVDMLGRAGKLEDAFNVVKSMPMGPNDTVLGAMLGACRIHSDPVMAENVIKFVGKLDSHYVLLSNIYAESEKWEMAEGARVVFSARGTEKTPGCSALMV
ncbi:hypothetical protein CASFOL_021854 [Castilleja foliolosa]|uniref:Pentatricopeptide repeat-containing protein n=1 Tax=Castilleja foliolosa TaxID=1961234 RepID=A0ABD3CXS8_9LAMI